MISGFRGLLPSCSDRVCEGVYLHARVPFPLFWKRALPPGVSTRAGVRRSTRDDRLAQTPRA